MKDSSRKLISNSNYSYCYQIIKGMKMNKNNKTIRWKTKLDVVKDDNNLYHIRFSNDGSNYFEIDTPYPSIEAAKLRLNEICSVIEETGKFEVKSKRTK